MHMYVCALSYIGLLVCVSRKNNAFGQCRVKMAADHAWFMLKACKMRRQKRTAAQPTQVGAEFHCRRYMWLQHDTSLAHTCVACHMSYALCRVLQIFSAAIRSPLTHMRTRTHTTAACLQLIKMHVK